jgi:hypothetical protein
VPPDAAAAHAHPFTNLPLPKSLQHERENLLAARGKAKHWHYTVRFFQEHVQRFKSVSRVQSFANIRAMHVYVLTGVK